MKKEQIKLNNFALTMALERYRACYDIELDAKKMWRKEARKRKRHIAELMAIAVKDKATINQLQGRIYHLENRGGNVPDPRLPPETEKY